MESFATTMARVFQCDLERLMKGNESVVFATIHGELGKLKTQLAEAKEKLARPRRSVGFSRRGNISLIAFVRNK